MKGASGKRTIRFTFAGGGTGGHLYPLISVAEELAQRIPEAEFVFLTTDRPIDNHVVSVESSAWRNCSRVLPQAVRPIPRRATGWWTFWRAWRAAIGQCQREFQDRRPGVVIGSGGFGCGPALVVAQRMGIPRVLLNPDAVPGLANRYLARRADRVCVQWESSKNCFSDGSTVVTTGCPVRRVFGQADRAHGIHTLGLDAKRRTLLVTGASQGSRSINQTVAMAWERIGAPAGWQVVHIAGQADVSAIQESMARFAVSGRAMAYTDQMADVLAASDLVISRAGASTLAELTALGRPSILMPYPHHRDRHQFLNAQELAGRGAAMVVEDRIDPAKNVGRLLDAILPLMKREDDLKTMAHRAGMLGVPDAAARVVRQVMAICQIEVERAGAVQPGKSVDDTHGAIEDWSEFTARDDEMNGDAKSSIHDNFHTSSPARIARTYP